MSNQFISDASELDVPEPNSPIISVVIVSYNMAREIPRTVHSFLPPYQMGLQPGDVEIIVLENGSSRPVSPEIIASWPASVRYARVEDPQPSPARALNEGVAMSRGDFVCPVIDGARMASPGLLSTAFRALQFSPRAVAATIGCHLGEKQQQLAVEDGYNQQVEDDLLRSIDWPEDGYRLFEIAAPAGSSQSAWFEAISESNAPVLSRRLYSEIGGYDERFDIPGGGLVNLDFFRRLVDDSSVEYLLVLGEATFHQFHGGVTTSKSVGQKDESGKTAWSVYANQYQDIHGFPYATSRRQPLIVGGFPRHAARLAHRGLTNALNKAD